MTRTAAAPSDGDSFGRCELIWDVDGPVVRSWICRAHIAAQRATAHDFDAAADRGGCRTCVHRGRGQVDRLLAGAALAVDRCHANLVPQTRVQPGIAADMAALLARLGDASGENLADRPRTESGPLHDGTLYVPEHGLGLETGEPATALADRRPDRCHDDRLAHALHPCVRSRAATGRRRVRATAGPV